MNTESSQDQEMNTNTSIGARLRQAREKMGLTQQTIAERLCLKLSTVRDLEEDKNPSDLAPTFLHGYIRSYAKLVQVPVEELLPLLEKQTPNKVVKVAPIQTMLLGKQRKKRDGWLMAFTWLVLFVVVGLTAAWWWHNHQANQEDIINMSNESSVQLSQQKEGQVIDLNNSAQKSAGQTPVVNANVANSVAKPAATNTADTQVSAAAVQSSATPDNAVVAPSQAAAGDISGSASATASEQRTATSVSNGIVMNFSGDCWLEVRDATGKVLFSGMQRSGGNLNLSGTAPYKVKIGAPAAVQMQYQGKPVDLSRFVKAGLVARFTLDAE